MGERAPRFYHAVPAKGSGKCNHHQAKKQAKRKEKEKELSAYLREREERR